MRILSSIGIVALTFTGWFLLLPVAGYPPAPEHQDESHSETEIGNERAPRSRFPSDPATATLLNRSNQPIAIEVSGFADNQRRLDQLRKSITAAEQLLEMPYPVPRITMTRASRDQLPACGQNKLNFHKRFIGGPYRRAEAIIRIRPNPAECGDTALTITHEVAHGWFSGNAQWLDEGLANYVERQVAAQVGGGPQPRPGAHCPEHANISEHEQEIATIAPKTPLNRAQNQCSNRLGAGLIDALHHQVGHAEFNRRIAQLAKSRVEVKRQRHDVATLHAMFGQEPAAAAIIEEWYAGQPDPRHYEHLNWIEWETAPTRDGAYLHFAGQLTGPGKIHVPGIGPHRHCNQFTLLQGSFGNDFAANLAVPLNTRQHYLVAPDAAIVNFQVNPKTGHFSITAQLHDPELTEQPDLALGVSSRVKPKDGIQPHCRTAQPYAILKVQDGKIAENLKQIEHRHSDRIEWNGPPQRIGDRIILSGKTEPGTLNLDLTVGECPQLQLKDRTNIGYKTVESIRPRLTVPGQSYGGLVALEVTQWTGIGEDGEFQAEIKVKPGTLEQLEQPLLTIRQKARSNKLGKHSFSCNQSEVIAAIDLYEQPTGASESNKPNGPENVRQYRDAPL